MKCVLPALVLGLFFAAISNATATAQARPTASGPGSYVSIGGGGSVFQADYGKQHIAGAFAFVDANPQWRVGLEGEARFLRYNTLEQVTETNYLGGIRVQILRPRRFQPYVKFLAGVGRITLPFGYAHGAFLDYAPGAGLDLALTNRMSLRTVDLEYQRWPQFPFGPLSPYGVSAGLSFRLNPIERYPTVRRRVR